MIGLAALLAVCAIAVVAVALMIGRARERQQDEAAGDVETDRWRHDLIGQLQYIGRHRDR